MSEKEPTIVDLTQRVEKLERENHLLKRAVVESQCALRMAIEGKNIAPWHVKRLNVCDGPEVELHIVDRHSQKQEEDVDIVKPTGKESLIVTETRNRRT